MILPTSSVFCPSRFFSNLKLAEGAVGILYSAFCLLRLPRTQLLDSGFWILKISGSLSGGEPSWELEVGKLRSWILVARSGAGLAILETVFWETELEFEI